MESLDSYYAVTDDSGEILAGAGIAGSVLKCLAVSETLRSSGMLVPLVSRIMSEHPGPLKVFTKPEYQTVFESMGFRLLASAPLAILLENGRGLEQYCAYLHAFRQPGTTGVVVMNANPFTLGHRYLLEQASARVDHLFVIPVKEDCSDFLYEERLAMIKAGAPVGVTVLEGSDYVISAATFPTYFLKDLSQAAETHMRLDLDLYSRWIAPALGATIRFVGSEPLDALTNRYNQLITQSVVVTRLELDGIPVSASRVRNALSLGRLTEASSLCPASSNPFLLAALAQRALFLELDTPMKPGLVCPDSRGAHSDMDYSVMAAGIRALRPFWSQMALAPDAPSLIALGIEAEKAMMAATGGVNTHRGAIFCLGLALNAAHRAFERVLELSEYQQDVQILLVKNAEEVLHNQQNNNTLQNTPLTGARAIAATGYRQLFEDWLPYYRQCLAEGKEGFPSASALISAEGKPSFHSAELMTLLKIMSTLDDTCVVHRVGKERAERVKEEADALLKEMPGQAGHDEKVAGHDGKGGEMPEQVGHDGGVVGHDVLHALCEEFAAERISPGGAADMLALTIFIHSILS